MPVKREFPNLCESTREWIHSVIEYWGMIPSLKKNLVPACNDGGRALDFTVPFQVDFVGLDGIRQYRQFRQYRQL